MRAATGPSPPAPPENDVDRLYPPEPWHLGGSMHVSLWRVPIAALPATFEAARPRDARPIAIAGTALVGTAFVTYEPGGVLAYDELLAATLTWHRSRPRVTISDIWVDSQASLAGGRELWGIPKHLADFSTTRQGGIITRSASVDGRPLAHLEARVRTQLPGRWPLPMPTAQRLGGIEHVSPVRASGGLATCRARWTFPPDGPLAFLTGRRPAVSVHLRELALAFGSAREVA